MCQMPKVEKIRVLVESQCVTLKLLATFSHARFEPSTFDSGERMHAALYRALSFTQWTQPGSI